MLAQVTIEHFMTENVCALVARVRSRLLKARQPLVESRRPLIWRLIELIDLKLVADRATALDWLHSLTVHLIHFSSVLTFFIALLHYCVNLW